MGGSKLLFITRHAKSSWKDPGLRDRQRPLNKRGKRDAPVVGKRLAARAEPPEAIVSSPAVRAAKTAKVIAKSIGLATDEITFVENIYGADAGGLVEVIRNFDDRYARVMLVGHNPALTDLVNALAGTDIDNMPTCSVATVAFDAAHWGEIRPGKGALVDLDYPKK